MTNEYEPIEKRLLALRDIFIALALIGTMGVSTYGIVAHRDGPAMFYATVGLLFGVLAALWGAKLGDHRKTLPDDPSFSRDTHAVSPVIAVILMVAITVVLAATVFVLVNNIGGNQRVTPAMGWTQDNAAKTLMVNNIETGHQWKEFKVVGCTSPNGNDTVDPGDKLMACTGDVSVVYLPSNSLVYTTKF